MGAGRHYIPVMIEDADRLAEFERRFSERAARRSSYHEALALFEAMWEEARLLRPDLGADWREDIAPDIEVARALNGLPPTA